MEVTANKALHRTEIPLRSIAAGELGRWASVTNPGGEHEKADVV
jgi:hypothetical protein